MVLGTQSRDVLGSMVWRKIVMTETCHVAGMLVNVSNTDLVEVFSVLDGTNLREPLTPAASITAHRVLYRYRGGSS